MTSARRNDYDVTNTVQTTDPAGVQAEIGRIFHGLYPQHESVLIEQAVGDAARLFRGEYPGYAACDTDYHDLQHTLDVSPWPATCATSAAISSTRTCSRSA